MNAGVLVRYHPCSVYAREGSPCPYFKSGSKRCSKPPLSCEMPEYNKWFKDVLAGKIQFFPMRRRSYLFKILGVPLFLYHWHEKKIVGEAAIVKVTEKNGVFHYWFNEFLSYPNFVDLDEIKTDHSLRRLTGKGRWGIKYLTERTIEEVRNLSGLPTEMKEKLANELQNVKQKIAEMPRPRYPSHRGDSLALARSKLQEIKLERQVDATVLNEAYQIFSKAVEKGILRGRSNLDFVYASLYTAYRVLKIPITIEEISKLYSLKPKGLARNYRTLLRRLRLTAPTPSPKDFVIKYSQHLPISQETIKLATSIIETTEKSLIWGRSPHIVAATAIHIACKAHDELITQEQIAKTFGTSSMSIRNYVKLLRKKE